MNTFLFIAVFIVAALFMQTIALWAAARVWRLPKRSWSRAAWIALAQLALAIILLPLSLWFREDAEMSIAVAVLAVILEIGIAVWLMRRLFGGSLGPVMGAWLVSAILGGVASAGLVLLLQFFIGAYVNDANSMAPNLRGKHRVETLADGNHLIVGESVPGPGLERGGRPTGGIVAETFESREVDQLIGQSRSADRFLCNKTKFPDRWDATVFKYPQNTAILYVKRLVGLPGERLEIHDGAVWINGARINPPERLGPVRYATLERAGDNEMPFEITLGQDEYFVLGDNTQRSADSRVWGPIKRDLIVGVVDLIYWPPNRWRLNP